MAVIASSGCLRIKEDSERAPGETTDRDIQIDAMKAEYQRAKSGVPAGVLVWASTVTAIHRNAMQAQFPEVNWDDLADEAMTWLEALERDAENFRYGIEAMRAKAHLLAARGDKAGALAVVDKALVEIEDYFSAMQSLESHAALGVPLDRLDDVCAQIRTKARSDEEVFHLIEVCRELNPNRPSVDAIPWVSEADRGAWERISQFNAGMEAYRREREQWLRARERDSNSLIEQYR